MILCNYYYTQSSVAGTGNLDHNRIYHRVAVSEEVVNAMLNPPKAEDIGVVLPEPADGLKLVVNEVKVLPEPVKYEQLGKEDAPAVKRIEMPAEEFKIVEAWVDTTNVDHPAVENKTMECTVCGKTKPVNEFEDVDVCSECRKNEKAQA